MDNLGQYMMRNLVTYYCLNNEILESVMCWMTRAYIHIRWKKTLRSILVKHVCIVTCCLKAGISESEWSSIVRQWLGNQVSCYHCLGDN
jgi:hypothetical protein